MPDRDNDVFVAVPAAVIDAIADAVSERLARRPPPTSQQPASPWMDFETARGYLGFSRDQLYKLTAACAIPFRRKAGGQGLRFHRAELDAWMEEAYPRVDRLAEGELRSPVFSLNQAENRA
jgi:excisionase family DNA binding protein